MQPGERPADGGAMVRLNASWPHSGEKRHDRRGASAQLAQSDAVAPSHRRRAGDPLPRQMLHQRNEKRQVPWRDPLFIKGQNEIAVHGRQQVIRVLYPLGDPLAGQHLADVVERCEGSELFVGDLGVDSHINFFPRLPSSWARWAAWSVNPAACLPGPARIQSAPWRTAAGSCGH